MAVWVAVRFFSVPGEVVIVLVMFVMHMVMRMESERPRTPREYLSDRNGIAFCQYGTLEAEIEPISGNSHHQSWRVLS
jgi:hypothetical protein